ncbi:sulfatase-like hydrolase/transferase [Candidatus Woesearchaeota archaeon]|nr:sulfatase-like hydrolase/transferase [Candidatus Woesearchaeota archaeon]
MKKQPNVFCVLVDGNRAKPGKDMHSRLKAFDTLGKENISFKEVITSASSTLMSFAGIITGRFAYGLFPCFFDFSNHRFKEDNYFRRFKKAGYNVQSQVFYNTNRLYFQDEINARQIKDRTKWFNHDEMFEEFKFLVNNNWDKKKPNFIFCHAGFYENGDKLVSDIVNFLKDKRLYDDSIFILSSDHGYIDYGKFHYLGWLLHPKVHSLYVDEDTLKTNLVIHLPKSISNIKHKVINNPVCVIDIFETVLDYLNINRNIKIGNIPKRAISFKDLIEKNDQKIIKKANNRLIRSDTRYLLQNYNQTSIRNKFYKLIRGEKRTNFYKLKKGKEIHIKHPSLYEKKQYKKFKNFLRKVEKESRGHIITGIDYLYKRSKLSKLKNNKIGIYNFSNKILIRYLKDKLSKNNKVRVLCAKKIKNKHQDFDFILFVVNNSDFFHYISILEFCKKKGIKTLLFNLGLNEIKYGKYAFWNDIYNQVFVMNKTHSFILKMALLAILTGIKIESWISLRSNKNCYLPV